MDVSYAICPQLSYRGLYSEEFLAPSRLTHVVVALLEDVCDVLAFNKGEVASVRGTLLIAFGVGEVVAEKSEVVGRNSGTLREGDGPFYSISSFADVIGDNRGRLR